MIGDYLMQLRGPQHMYNAEYLPEGVQPDMGDYYYTKAHFSGGDRFVLLGKVVSSEGKYKMTKGYPHVEIELVPKEKMPLEYHYLYCNPQGTFFGKPTILRLFNGCKILEEREKRVKE